MTLSNPANVDETPDNTFEAGFYRTRPTTPEEELRAKQLLQALSEMTASISSVPTLIEQIHLFGISEHVWFLRRQSK